MSTRSGESRHQRSPAKRLRSLLNVPGNRPRMLDRASASGADALVLDLEDSVPLDAKDDARRGSRERIDEWSALGRVTYVRINAAGSGMLDEDLDAIVGPNLTGVQIPKVNRLADVLEVDHRLAEFEARRSLERGSLEVIVGIESAVALFEAFTLLTVSSRTSAAILGIAEDGDLQRDLGYQTTADEAELLYVRSHFILAARAAGVESPLDGVFADYRNDVGLRNSARRARQLGYRGKKAIHPGQVAIINEAFELSDAERDRYTRVLAAFEDAIADGKATAVVDGKMIDYAQAESARRQLGQDQS